MDTPLNHVLIPVNFQELFSAWNRFPDAVCYAGGTNIIGRQENNILNLPPAFLCLDKIAELQKITRTEHYLEIGSMVRLNRLVNLGKAVPGVLRACIENIGGVQLRNIATIGGNICTAGGFSPDIPAPLIALDAQYELRNSSSSRWVSASRFHSLTENTTMEKQELVTRIRLPLHTWDYAVYKKFHGESHLNSAALVFLAKTHKNILSEIRVVYKAGSIVRNKLCEDILNGKSLPLSRKTSDDFIENWKDFMRLRREEPE
ncbi:MAG: FAD binding domain-containing protein, partial [Treponema sp.]|nr:FAD binding domain-containing protein [Treponema sp.]